MKRVIITGATSLIGVELVKECIRNGVEVTALVRAHSGKLDHLPQSDLLHVRDCELAQLQDYTLEGNMYDAFFHLGWQGTSKDGRMDPLLQEKNIQYTLDAVNLAKRCGCNTFIGAGSQAEYGPHLQKVTTPDSPIHPMEPYGMAKYAAGRLAEVLVKQNDMRFVWARIFSVFGKFEIETSMIQTTLRHMLKDEPCRFSAATQNWDYLYGEDAGKALFALGNTDRADGIYCLGSGQGRILKDFIYEMKKITHSDSELFFSKEPVPQGRGFFVDISKLQQDTGWQPHVDFDEGIQKTVEWIMSQN